jgi:hypothetical protein
LESTFGSSGTHFYTILLIALLLFLRRSSDKELFMKMVEYRCYRCMIVESKWLVNNVKSADYTTCSKCGGESKRISSESISPTYRAALHELKKESR